MASFTRITLRRANTNLPSLMSILSLSQSQYSPRHRLFRLTISKFQPPRRGYASGPEKKDPSTNIPRGTTSSSKDATPMDANASSGSDTSPLSSSVPPPTLLMKRERQAFASLDFAPVEPEDVGQGSANKLLTDGSSGTAGVERRHRTGARSAKDSLSSIERRRRRMGWISAIGFIGTLVGGWIWLGWEKGDENERGVWGWVARSNRNTLKLFDLFDKPIWEKLLPDKLPEPYQQPYTLLLSIDDLLVTSTWDRQHGWRTAKRPGVDYFLTYLSQFYEIVIFTTQSSTTSIPIIEALDPYNFYIQYHLFREATRTHKGNITKDLSYLNRDLSHVVALDTVAERYDLNPENVIEVRKWKAGKKGPGEFGDGDGGLVALIPFLESMAIFRVPDVRPVLSRYRGKDVALEWAKVEAENKARHVKEWEAKQAQLGGLAKGGWTMGRLLGNTPQPLPVPLTHLEQKRLEAQRNYQAEREFLEINREELERQKKKMQEEGMKAMMEGGMFRVLSRMGLGPTLPPLSPEPAPAPTPAGTKDGPMVVAAAATPVGQKE